MRRGVTLRPKKRCAFKQHYSNIAKKKQCLYAQFEKFALRSNRLKQQADNFGDVLPLAEQLYTYWNKRKNVFETMPSELRNKHTELCDKILELFSSKQLEQYSHWTKVEELKNESEISKIVQSAALSEIDFADIVFFYRLLACQFGSIASYRPTNNKAAWQLKTHNKAFRRRGENAKKVSNSVKTV